MLRQFSLLAPACVAASLLCSCIAPPPAVTPEELHAKPEAQSSQKVVLWPKTGVESLYQIDEVRAFRYVQRGQEIGRSYGRVAGVVEDGGRQLFRLETKTELQLPERAPVRSQGEIFVDTHGVLARGEERSEAAKVEFLVEGDEIRLRSGNDEDVVTFRPDTAYMAYMATMHEELMFATREIIEGEQGWRLVSLSGGAPQQWAGIGRRGAQPSRFYVETNLGEVVTISDGRIEQIDVEANDLSVSALTGSDVVWPDWEIAEPTTLQYQPKTDGKFTRVEVELTSRADQTQVMAELLRPTDKSLAKGESGLLPAVLFVDGSGLSDRYGFAGPPAVDLGYHAITDALAEAGFIVLRYDNPGQGQSEKREPLSWGSQLEDGSRALRTLLIQDEVDPDRIVIVGHSEGGWKALHLAKQFPRSVVGVALLGTPGEPYSTILEREAKRHIERMDTHLQPRAWEQHRELMTALEQGRSVPREFEKQKKWLQEILREKPAKLISSYDGKLFVAHGKKDFEVDVVRAQAALRRRGRRDGLYKVYSSLDHLFKEEAGVSTPAKYLDTRAVSPIFLNDFSRWARSTVKTK